MVEPTDFDLRFMTNPDGKSGCANRSPLKKKKKGHRLGFIHRTFPFRMQGKRAKVEVTALLIFTANVADSR